MSKYNGYRNGQLVAMDWTEEAVQQSKGQPAYRGITFYPVEETKPKTPEWVAKAIGQDAQADEQMGEPTPKKGKAKAEQEGN